MDFQPYSSLDLSPGKTSVFTSYEVKINAAGSNSSGVCTTIADSSHLVDVSIAEWWELLRESKVGMDDRKPEFAEVVGLTIECCDDDKVATLQLCWGGCGILIQLLHLEEIPHSLRTFLADDGSFVFVGVGIRDACAKLERNYGLKCEAFFELAPVASRVCRNSRFFDSNLEELAHEIAGITIDEKPTIPSLSLWGARDLRTEQIDYAITKAYASYSIGHELMWREVKMAASAS